eukprot:4809230-Pleurochrysis_carterae.AAC.2
MKAVFCEHLWRAAGGVPTAFFSRFDVVRVLGLGRPFFCEDVFVRVVSFPSDAMCADTSVSGYGRHFILMLRR